jgi:hypothetical protein
VESFGPGVAYIYIYIYIYTHTHPHTHTHTSIDHNQAFYLVVYNNINALSYLSKIYIYIYIYINKCTFLLNGLYVCDLGIMIICLLNGRLTYC